MVKVGIICEYNPFHNGHANHIKRSKSMTGADYTIAVMSGNFVQRGAPAVVDKFVRTKMALENGIDLVLEIQTAGEDDGPVKIVQIRKRKDIHFAAFVGGGIDISGVTGEQKQVDLLVRKRFLHSGEKL